MTDEQLALLELKAQVRVGIFGALRPLTPLDRRRVIRSLAAEYGFALPFDRELWEAKDDVVAVVEPSEAQP